MKIPATKRKLDEVVFGELRAMSVNGVIKENGMASSILVMKSLLRKADPMSPKMETRLHHRILRSMNPLMFQHRVLKPEQGRLHLSDRMDNPFMTFPPVDPSQPGYRRRGRVLLPEM
jgi:hypothetical protein